MRTITVTGHGAATALPDRAVVRLAAVHRSASMREALAGAESARAALVAVAGELVVSSTGLSVWPSHDHEGRQTGFEARHAVTVTGADLAAAGDLIGRVADEAGDRVQVESVALSVSDPAAALRKAREAAYADAQAAAEHLAALAGAVLGEVQSVTESPAGVVPLGAEGVLFAKGDVTLQPGETSLNAALTITWVLS